MIQLLFSPNELKISTTVGICNHLCGKPCKTCKLECLCRDGHISMGVLIPPMFFTCTKNPATLICGVKNYTRWTYVSSVVSTCTDNCWYFVLTFHCDTRHNMHPHTYLHQYSLISLLQNTLIDSSHFVWLLHIILGDNLVLSTNVFLFCSPPLSIYYVCS